MMSIVRCPGCGKAIVAVNSRRAKGRCARCGQPLPSSEKLSGSDPEALEIRVREHLYGPHGLSRPR